MNEVQQYASPEIPNRDATPTAIAASITASAGTTYFFGSSIYGTLS